MKLFEVLNQQIQLDIKTVSRYTDNFDELPGLKDSVSRLLKNPRFSFTGKLYRGIFLPDNVFENNNPTQLLQLIKNHSRATEVCGWSKTIRGMEQVLGHESDSGNVEDNGYVVISQQSMGLDINKLSSDRDPYLASEDEVLTIGLDPSIKIISFNAIRKFTPRQYPQFLDELRKLAYELEQDRSWDEQQSTGI